MGLISTVTQAVDLKNVEFVLLDDQGNRWRNPFIAPNERSQSTHLGTTVHSQTAFIGFGFDDNPPQWDQISHFSLYAIRKDRTERVEFKFVLQE